MRTPSRAAPSAGFEPAHTAPEAAALSPELRGRGSSRYQANLLGAVWTGRMDAGPENPAAATCCGSPDPLRDPGPAPPQPERRAACGRRSRAAGRDRARAPGRSGARRLGHPGGSCEAAKLEPREIAERVKAALEAAPPPTSSGSRSPARASSTSSCAHVAARRAAHRRPPAIPTTARNSARVSRSTSSSCRPTRPARCTPAAGGGSPSATRSPTCSRAGRRGAPRVLPQRRRQPARQVRRLAAARYRGEEPPEDGYQGQYLVEMAATCMRELGDDVDAEAPSGATTRSSKACGDDLARIGVHFDTWFSERTLHERGDVAECSRLLERRGATYEADGATWLRATDFGDSATACSSAPTATPTYLCNDLAYHRDKFARGFTHLIDIWGADHHGQVKSLQAGMEALGYPPGEPEIMLGQLVKLLRGGEEVRSRSAPATSSPSPTSSTRSTPTCAASRSCSRASTRRRRSTSTSSPRSRWRTPSTTCSTHARIASIGRKAERAGVDRRPLETSTSRARARARRGAAALARAVSRRRRRGGRDARAAQGSRPGCATSPALPRLLPRLPGDHRRRGAHPGPPVAGRGVPDRARQRLGDPRRARPRRDVARTTTTMTTTARPRDRPARPTLLPRRAGGGRRRPPIGGVDLVDSPTLRHAAVRLRRGRAPRAALRTSPTAFGAGVAYAGKAFLCVAMARLVGRGGLHLDVATGGELHVALRAGFPPDRIVFHGNNKSTTSSRRVRRRRRRIVVDSFDELDRIERLAPSAAPCGARAGHAGRRGAHARVHRDRHRGLRSSASPRRRRGAGPRPRASTSAASARRPPLPHRVADLRPRPFARRREVVTALRRDRGGPTGGAVEELNLGGGLGVRYLADDRRPVDRRVRGVRRTRSTRRAPMPGSTEARR